MRRIVFCLALLVALSSVPSSAQTCVVPPSPGAGWVMQDCGWLPAGHPAIRTVTMTLQECVAAQPSTATNLDLLRACSQYLGTSIPGCDHVNAYEEPERANECSRLAALTSPKPQPRVFVLGAIYSRPYGERKILIIGKALGIAGVEVITAQIVVPEAEAGTAIAFRNDGGVDAGQWWPVQ